MTDEEMQVMDDTIAGLRDVVQQLSAENLSLKRQLTEKDNRIVDNLISYLKEFKYD